MVVQILLGEGCDCTAARFSCQAMQACCLLMYPSFGDLIIYSLVAYLMGTARTRIAPGKKTENGGKRTMLQLFGLCKPLAGILFHCFLVANSENDCAKNWKDQTTSSLTRGGANDALPSGTLVFWPLFNASLGPPLSSQKDPSWGQGKQLCFFRQD